MTENRLFAPFDEPAKEDTRYFSALGRFITTYAAAEAAVHTMARKLSGLTDEKARIIFGGMRLSDLVDRIRQMMRLDNAPPEIYDEVDGCLIQLNAIADKRHNLVHRMVEYQSGALHVTNSLTAKSIAVAEKEVFTETDLHDMRGDCARIYVRLVIVKSATRVVALKPQVFAMIHAPWYYKPARPNPPKQPRQKARSKQPRPPRASGG